MKPKYTPSNNPSSSSSSLDTKSNGVVSLDFFNEAADILWFYGHQPPARPCDEEVSLVSRVFDTLDENKDGKLSSEELAHFLGRLGLGWSHESISSLFLELEQHAATGPSSLSGREHARFVTHNDFLSLYEMSLGASLGRGRCRSGSHLVVEHEHEHEHEGHWEEEEENDEDDDDGLVSEVFGIFDKDKDGFISPMELHQLLNGLGFQKEACALGSCVDMIGRFDQDGDGQINLLEFKDMLECAL